MEEQDWRTVVSQWLADPEKRERLQQNLSPTTLRRWIRGDTDPRGHNLATLLSNCLSHEREQLVPLLRQAGLFPKQEATEVTAAPSAGTIPAELYAMVLELLQSTSDALRETTLTSMILRQALKHLDPHRLGLSLSLVRCLPPRQPDGLVRSLRITCLIGTPPLGEEQVRDLPSSLLLGIDSLAGVAVSSYQLAQADLTHDPALAPCWLPSSTGREQSAAAAPLLFAGRVAGAMQAVSTQAGYFFAERLALLHGYAALAALALEHETFYERARVRLSLLPSPQIQQQTLATLPQRVLACMRAHPQTPLSSREAQQAVLQHIEQEWLEPETPCAP